MGKVSAEYTRLSIEIAAAKIFGRAEEAAHLRMRQQVEVAMTGINDRLTEARAKLADGVGDALARLSAFEAERDRVPAAYFDAERARIVREARIADQEAMHALAEYQRDGLTEARNMRVAAEATMDPTTRMADMMERKQLAESPLDADALVERAREMLDAGQPKRAALYLDAAADKGGSMTVHGVREAVEDALDASVPERARARIIEQDVTASVAGFRQARRRQLYDSRLGLRRVDGDGPGEVGSGNVSDVASASLSAKVEAFANARASGQPYVDPVPETSGVGPDVPSR